MPCHACEGHSQAVLLAGETRWGSRALCSRNPADDDYFVPYPQVKREALFVFSDKFLLEVSFSFVLLTSVYQEVLLTCN